MTSHFLFKFCIILHWHDTWYSSVDFKLVHFLLWIKGSHQSRNFETFDCSGKNFPNSSCHFPNYKSVFPQILHHSSVLWNITFLYIFISNIICLVEKEPVKVQIFKTFGCSGQNASNCGVNFETNFAQDFQKFWNHPSKTRAISKFSKIMRVKARPN